MNVQDYENMVNAVVTTCNDDEQCDESTTDIECGACEETADAQASSKIDEVSQSVVVQFSES